MKSRFSLALLILVLSLGLVLAGCGGGDKKDAKGSNVVKVGVFLPLTGDNAAGGDESIEKRHIGVGQLFQSQTEAAPDQQPDRQRISGATCRVRDRPLD